MKIDTKFPVWLWLVGWVLMFFAAMAADQLSTVFDYITVAAWLLLFWPVHLGLTIGEIWLAVQ